jgi:hypothetical protein
VVRWSNTIWRTTLVRLAGSISVARVSVVKVDWWPLVQDWSNLPPKEASTALLPVSASVPHVYEYLMPPLMPQDVVSEAVVV